MELSYLGRLPLYNVYFSILFILCPSTEEKENAMFHLGSWGGGGGGGGHLVLIEIYLIHLALCAWRLGLAPKLETTFYPSLHFFWTHKTQGLLMCHSN